MATSQSKRRKLESENRSFNESWTTDYFFVEHNGKPHCLLCGTIVSVFKEYNVKRHYENYRTQEKNWGNRKHLVSSLQSALKSTAGRWLGAAQ